MIKNKLLFSSEKVEKIKEPADIISALEEIRTKINETLIND